MSEVCSMGHDQRPGVDDALRQDLIRFVHRHFGATAAPADVQPMLGGHAGLTFGFAVVDGGETLGEYIIKLAPKGVRREGNTDVYRTAPLLRTLYRERLPVPDVPFASPDEDEFGVPYVVMSRLPGREFFIWDPDPSFDLADAKVAPLWRQMAEVLPGVHKVDWQRYLPNWETPRPLVEEITRWEKIYGKALEPEWIELADVLRLRLLKTMPDRVELGIVHGDYQPGNGLFADGKLTGIIDWELVRIGSFLVDIGWLMFSADKNFWTDNITPAAPVEPEELADIYQAGMGRSFAHLRWYQALAAYQLGSIACLNVRLHRKQQRIDPMWEEFAQTVPRFFTAAVRLIS
ncbi:MAG: phosphotransferase family protein [Porticoccaceae bacterium]